MKERIPVKLLPEPMLINIVKHSTSLEALRRLAEYEKGN
jgi:hypothetical protein